MKSRKLWLTSVLAWHSEQQEHPILETEKLLSSQYQYYEQDLLIKRWQIISEIRKITLQIYFSRFLCSTQC